MPPRPDQRALKGRSDILRVTGPADASSGINAVAKAAETVGSAINAPLRAMAGQLEKEVEKDFEARGREQALAAPETKLANGGTVPRIALREGTSLTSEAFNRGVMSVAPQRLQSSLIEGMSAIEQQHVADPKGYETSANTLFQQLTNAAPDELKAALELDWTRRKTAGLQRQNKQFVDQEVAKVRATNADTLEQLGESAAMAAFNTVTTNPDERQVNGAIVEDARQKFDAILEQFDPLGDPIYSEEEKRKAKKAFEENLVIQGARGGFERASDKEKYIAAWLDRKKKDGDLGLDLIDRVGSELLSDLRVHNSLQASARRQSTKEVKEALEIYGRGEMPQGVMALRQRLGAVGDQASLDALDRAATLQQDMKHFRQSPLTEQMAMLQELRAKDTMTIEESDRMVAYEMNLGKAANGLKKDPIGWARQTDVIQDAPANPTSFAMPELLQREKTSQIVQDQYDLTRQPFLRPGEADIMAQNLSRMTPPEAIEAAANLGDLSMASQRDIVSKVGEKLPGMDVAIEMSMVKDGKEAAMLYFEGQRALLEGVDVQIPQMDLAEAMDAAGVTAAYVDQPEAFVSISRAAEGIAVALAMRENNITGAKDQLDQAVRLAAGGIVEHNGRPVAPPLPQMDEDEMEDMIERLSDGDLVTFGNGAPMFSNGKALTAEMLADDMQLKSFSPGQYLVVDEAGRAVITQDGPYLLDLREAWLEGRSAVRGDDTERAMMGGG